jgi:hypothetical protein
MRWIMMSAGVVLVAASLAGAFDEPKKKPPAKESPPAKERSDKATDKKETGKNETGKKEAEESEKSVAEQIAAVQAEMSEQQQKLVKQYRASTDADEKAKIIEQFNKLQADVLEKYVAIVKKSKPDDKDLFPALSVLVASGQQTELAIDLLLKHHVDNPEMGVLCFQLGRQGAPGGEKLFRAVAEKSKSNDAKGLAWLALGQSLFGQSNQGDLADDKRDELRKEAEEALQTVIDKFADAKLFNRTAGDLAAGTLFEVQHLAVGKEVPDLEGEDLDGTEFKLSDYRGKVVFLDFWAHW